MTKTMTTTNVVTAYDIGWRTKINPYHQCNAAESTVKYVKHKRCLLVISTIAAGPGATALDWKHACGREWHLTYTFVCNEMMECEPAHWLTSVFRRISVWPFLRSSPFYGSGVNKLIRSFMVYKRVEPLRNRVRNEERQFWQMAFLAAAWATQQSIQNYILPSSLVSIAQREISFYSRTRQM